MDSWDGYREGLTSDLFVVEVDGVKYSWTFGRNTNNTDTDYVLGRYNEVDTWGENKDFYFDDFYNGFVFGHSSDSLTIKFYGENLSGLHDESWRVTDVDISTSVYLANSDMRAYIDVSSPFLLSWTLMPLLLIGCRRKTGR